MHFCSRPSAAWPLWSKQKRCCRQRFVGATGWARQQQVMGHSSLGAGAATDRLTPPAQAQSKHCRNQLPVGCTACPLEEACPAWRRGAASTPQASIEITQEWTSPICLPTEVPGWTALPRCKTCDPLQNLWLAHPLPDGNHVLQSGLLNLLDLI